MLCTPGEEDELPDLVASPEVVSQSEKSLQDILGELARQVRADEICRFTIFRGELWECVCRSMKRASYTPNKAMFVKFADGRNEKAVDQGGPARELMRLGMKKIQASFFDSNGYMRMDANGGFRCI